MANAGPGASGRSPGRGAKPSGRSKPDFSQITVTTLPASSVTNPTVNVKIQTNLPTFFARIWGRTQVTVAASATAEAYNPSPTGVVMTGGSFDPVAPICVKPWLLPNISPKTGGHHHFQCRHRWNQRHNFGWETLAPRLALPAENQVPRSPWSNCLPATSAYRPHGSIIPATTDATTGSFPPPATSLRTCSPAALGSTIIS